jgi:hypothetical protein
MTSKMRAPVPDDVRTEGEDKPLHGTNPWSGPYFVLAIIIGALLLVGASYLRHFSISRVKQPTSRQEHLPCALG